MRTNPCDKNACNLDETVAALDAKQQGALAAFGKLVERFADGQKLDPEHVGEILRAADKSPGELQSAVARLRQGRELAAELEHATAAGPKADELQAQVDELITQREAAIATARQRCAEVGGPIEAEISKLRAQAARASELKARLRKEHPNLAPEPTPQERQDARAAFTGLAESLAAGNRHEASYVDGILAAAGKTHDDLARAVEQAQRGEPATQTTPSDEAVAHARG